jgi:hypothetical protein
MKRTRTFLMALLLTPLAALHAADPAAGQAKPQPPALARPAQARPPAWAAKGAYVFRVSTPDEADVLPRLEEGHAIVAGLLDGTVPQITIVAGLIGHDHPGAWNWDGLWPYWNRATFRAGSFEKLAAFMARAKKNSNVHTGFHLNLTDVNIGLRDYPESRAFFQKLVETKSIYGRDWNKAARRREGEPFVPLEIEKYADNAGNPNPVQIFALVNYKQFWDSGLAKEMIDGFYAKLPIAPPMLYLDVLNAGGGNFSTGFPDGPLGGSQQTQIEGMQAIADYLRSKGTDLGTEGNRPFLGANAQGLPRAGYVWLHGSGFSADDYSVISGGGSPLVSPLVEQTYGSAGAFNVSPVASTRAGLDKVRAHYAALLAGRPGTKAVPDLKTWRIALRSGKDEFDIPGTGDAWRGDWADLVNNFYLITIQELYHIGNRSVRQRIDSIGHVHLGTYTVTNPAGAVTVAVYDSDVPEWQRKVRQEFKRVMIYGTETTKVNMDRGGKYALKVTCYLGGRSDNPKLGIYVNGRHHRSFDHLPIPGGSTSYELDAGEIELQAGENTIAFDSGVISAKWSDGTQAEWTTPSLPTGLRVWKDDVVFAVDYDRMWPDTWSGQKKIYFYSWDGTKRAWKLPADWGEVPHATLYPLTPDGRGSGVPIAIKDRTIMPSLLPQVPYIFVPETQSKENRQ